MNILKHIIILLTAFTAITSYAQKVSNITFRQEQSNIIVYYDLETKTPCKVSLYVSTDGDITWKGPLTKVTGDVGNKIISGSNNITWNVLEEFEELKGDNIKFQVKAIGSDIETIKIGTQEWTTKNLNVSTYRNGDEIPEVKDPEKWKNLTTGAWCYYDNDPKNGEIYGKLYNCYAVNDPRGLAPKGYRIPKISELETLKELKDMEGFAALPGGLRDYYSGQFREIKETGIWWSSTLDSIEEDGYYLGIDFINGKVFKQFYSQHYGFSVFCIKK